MNRTVTIYLTIYIYILIHYNGLNCQFKVHFRGTCFWRDRCGFYGDRPSVDHVIRIVRRYTYQRAKHIAVTRALFDIIYL